MFFKIIRFLLLFATQVLIESSLYASFCPACKLRLSFRAIKYSAACNVLPLNTWIKVTNLRNEKSIIVKTNDRLHAKNKRLIDLSRIAAKELEYLSRGLTKVKVEVLNNFHLEKE